MDTKIAEVADAKASHDATVSNVTAAEILTSPFPGMLAIGTKVKQKVNIIHGEIKRYHLGTDGITFGYIVGYEEDGNQHEHFFTHDQIEGEKQ